MMTLYQSLLSPNVSSLLCTQNLGPEEVHVHVSVHDETNNMSMKFEMHEYM